MAYVIGDLEVEEIILDYLGGWEGPMYYRGSLTWTRETENSVVESYNASKIWLGVAGFENGEGVL